MNLVLIQKMKERWAISKKMKNDGRIVDSPYPSGEWEPVGFKEAGYIVQVNLRHSWAKEKGFIVEVVNCRQNMEIAGTEYPGLTLPELGQLVFPESTEEDWS